MWGSSFVARNQVAVSERPAMLDYRHGARQRQQPPNPAASTSRAPRSRARPPRFLVMRVTPTAAHTISHHGAVYPAPPPPRGPQRPLEAPPATGGTVAHHHAPRPARGPEEASARYRTGPAYDPRTLSDRPPLPGGHRAPRKPDTYPIGRFFQPKFWSAIIAPDVTQSCFFKSGEKLP